jgi:hypothetical protein
MPELLEFNLKAKRKPINIGAVLAVGTIQLEEGKQYITQDGEITSPMKKYGDGFMAHCMNNHPEWGHNGTWKWSSNGLFSGPEWEQDKHFPMHIVKEYVKGHAPVPGLKLQEGKYYKTIGGHIVGPVGPINGAQWHHCPMKKPDGTPMGSCWFLPNGLFQGAFTEPNPTYESHIIEEVATPVASPAPAPAVVAKASFLPLQAGKKYVLGDGEVVGPLEPMMSNIHRLRWSCPGKGVRSWYIEDGKRNGYKDLASSPKHIVAEYMQPVAAPVPVEPEVFFTKEEATVLWHEGVPLKYAFSEMKAWYTFPTKESGHSLTPSAYSLFKWKKG